MTSTTVTAATLFAPVLLAMAAESKAFENPVIERYVAPPWMESRRNSGVFGNTPENVSFKVSEREWKGSSVIAFESERETILADANGGWVAHLGAHGNALAQWAPPLNFAYPLEVDKSWTHSHLLTDAAGKAMAFDVTCGVRGYGEAKVPAGVFKAFEIQCKDPVALRCRSGTIPLLESG
ncbi:hypothetical protein QTI24_27255 [Variovorax sp. J22P240]|uniref:hypothetical protein n=1 Tax=Variovorax sp. J22P240 TaxID=3053514 RepID=UPI0025761A88|nr:hypothetical protein [Variovorax sp. J22P240]MDM0002330.1 hypothetical protein [Variovorax sp. J22P240]